MNNNRNELRGILRRRFPREHGQLLPALHFLQHEFGYLPDWAMEVVGWHLGIPSSEVYGAATSYTELRIDKPGEHVIRICTGLSCLLNGGGRLMEQARAALGGNSDDGIPGDAVTLEESPCGFLCGVAPAVEVDGVWQGKATPQSLAAVLKEVSS